MSLGREALEQVTPGIWRVELSVPLGPRWPTFRLRVNSYVLEAPDGLYLVDCGPFALYYRLRALAAHSFPHKKVLRVYITHGHFDHAGAGLRCISEGIEMWATSEEEKLLSEGGPIGVPQVFRYPAFQPTRHIEEGHLICLGNTHNLEAVLVPGHTPGSVCFHDEEKGVLLYGDLLFGPLRGYAVTFLLELLTAVRQPKKESMQQIESLKLFKSRLEGHDHTLLLPGHGPSYYSEAHPRAFDRSLGILRWILRLKR